MVDLCNSDEDQKEFKPAITSEEAEYDIDSNVTTDIEDDTAAMAHRDKVHEPRGTSVSHLIWRLEDERALLNFAARHEALYNLAHIGFRARNKMAIWDELIQSLPKDCPEIHPKILNARVLAKKLSSLKIKWRKEVRAINANRMKSGICGDQKNQSRWELFELCNFWTTSNVNSPQTHSIPPRPPSTTVITPKRNDFDTTNVGSRTITTTIITNIDVKSRTSTINVKTTVTPLT